MSVIEVEHLEKRYGDQIAVCDVSFSVERGEIFGIIGQNGAGKTTTVECVEGLRVPDRGVVRVLGLDPLHDRAELKQRMGAQLQSSQLPPKLKVWEALDLYSSFYPQPADWEQLIAGLGLTEKRNATFDVLSGGQKQRLSIALALAGSPEVLILDELTTGLDPQARRNIWRLIEDVRERGVTILLVTHFMEEAERLCDRLAMLHSGEVVALGTPAEIVSLVAPEQRLHFRPSAPIDDGLLADLPEVRSLTRKGAVITVAGSGNLVQAVTSVLARNRVVAEDLRFERAGLDDAFIALTGDRLENQPSGDLS
jgi:ABC-2 type transport system ATP-binding protein